ncbi:MAG: carbamate kinase [Candidatus Micrarchaeota archaeon]|nr:carbamate kinase [Candidatus Micrarchaeota archaeon]
METIVIAFGGNALLRPGDRQEFSVQASNVVSSVSKISGLLDNPRNRVVITHGNGPQVGDELIRNVSGRRKIPMLPLHAMNAETQALIGSMIELAIRNAVGSKGISVILTHTVVDWNDPAFENPTKPVGPILKKSEIGIEGKDGKYIKVGKGYRMAVGSPKPLKIVEERQIVSALADDRIVICCGGGGIPVIKSGKGLRAVDAVIDKDRSSALIASAIKADKLMILTNVDCVRNPITNKEIRVARSSDLRDILDEFDAGTMRPKIEACISFVQGGGKAAFIGNLDKIREIVKGRSGTRIIR